MIIVDNSRLVSTAECSTKTVMRYVLHYTTETENTAPRAGQDAHLALKSFFEYWNVNKALSVFEQNYKPFSDEFVSTDDRLHFSNLELILEQFFKKYTPETFPFTVIPGSLETGIKAPLVDGVELYSLIDMAVKDRVTGQISPMDHKTTGNITDWWLKKFRLISQLSGYSYSLGISKGVEVTNAYVNAIEFKKLPQPRKVKCRMHGVNYEECRLDHCKFQLIVAQRPAHMIQTWLKDAQLLARKFLLLSSYNNLEAIHYVQQEGKFNNSCTFCSFAQWCFMGRPIESVPGMFVRIPWMPWDSSAHLKQIF